MKKSFLLLLLCLLSWVVGAQKKITDKHITYQQERMVFKQWDADKFTPNPGFLGLNPQYWITWALHPNYPKTDLRPLGPLGPQTQRLMLAAAMQNTDNIYKLHADTLRNTALSEASTYSSDLAFADPLWLMYYRNEFDSLLNQADADMLSGLSPTEKQYMISSGLLEWYTEESRALLERLEIARSTTVDRGSRIMAYHRMLSEFRKLSASWETKKSRAKTYLAIRSSAQKLRAGEVPRPASPKSDIQIANDILKKSKL
ncbi:hypothetical protein [Pedobacter endophyticus]|uniref:DUF5045 domain-containing protein n=1 Tax=Pedobacter endophyticus TaxID=2789740 RepID=A0A7S9L135_9SPHI|nr:hypothetical protein [Pedobacter endophyticus]QPH40527.1 hypothetical protein IZT61_04395 [Pedobacter endophyticus]